MDSTFQHVLSETSSTGLDRPQMDLCSLSDLLRANSNPMATSHFPESFSLPPRTTATPEDLIGSASHERLIQCRNAAYITAQTELQTLRYALHVPLNKILICSLLDLSLPPSTRPQDPQVLPTQQPTRQIPMRIQSRRRRTMPMSHSGH